MSDIVSVYAIFADADEAARIGRAMIERRLAACVNIPWPLPLNLSLARRDRGSR
jgi:periplasmic divalent cation tolerance protein